MRAARTNGVSATTRVKSEIGGRRRVLPIAAYDEVDGEQTRASEAVAQEHRRERDVVARRK